jgi:putative membrane protein
MALTRKCLWALIALFALVSIAQTLASHVQLTAAYISILVVFALLHGALRYGLAGMAVFAAICLIVSNVLENVSVETGFPFGRYHYTDVLGPKLLEVPLLIGPAYLGVGYLSWTLATVLAGDVKRGSSIGDAAGTAAIGAFVMVLWDLAFDPETSTIGKWWIWQQGGGYFGVPLSNYVGWYFTVFVFMLLFALYLRVRRAEPVRPQPKGYYAQAATMYALVALLFVLNFLIKGSAETLTDASGAPWRATDIRETAAIVSLIPMLFAVTLAALAIARKPAD